jgi:TolB-like protein
MQIETENKITIDLNRFKLRINAQPKISVSLHFDSPSRRFYLSLIAMTVYQMKKIGKVVSIPLESHYKTIVLLNETVGESAGSSNKSKLFPRIYKKWKSDLPDLENAPLFRVLGKNKDYSHGMEKIYPFSEEEKDTWANLFVYKGSGQNVRLQLAIDSIGLNLDDISIVYEKGTILQDQEAWEKFVEDLTQFLLEAPESDQTFAGLKEPNNKTSPERVLIKRALRRTALSIVMLLIVVSTGIVVFKYSKKHDSIPGGPASIEHMAFPLPAQTSVAVLPFKNISGDPEQEYLADGITDNIITALSQIPDMFVIASNTVFTYKKNPVTIKQVSEDLGVRYVVEGSIQKSENILRVNVQLIDAIQGYHIWARGYDRELKDIFTLQDELIINVLTELQVNLTLGERAYEYPSCTDDLDMYLKQLRLREVWYNFTKGGNQQIRNFVKELLDLEPDCTQAYTDMGWTYLAEAVMGWSVSPGESLDIAEKWARKALSMPEVTPNTHSLMAEVYRYQKQYDEAITEHEIAVINAINPQDFYHFAGTLLAAGQPEKSARIYEHIMRRDPKPPVYHHRILGCAYFNSGNYEMALSQFQRLHNYFKAGRYQPSGPIFGGATHLHLAATYSMLGNDKEAGAHVKALISINPEFSLKEWGKYMNTAYKNEDDVDRWVEALHKVGLQ